MGGERVRLTALVRGRVQGVGFRDWVRRAGGAAGVSVRATNLDDGSVEVVADGPRERCERLLGLVRDDRGPGRVDDVDVRWEAR